MKVKNHMISFEKNNSIFQRKFFQVKILPSLYGRLANTRVIYIASWTN